jgi:MOSC domain-containing protein YiiM
MKDLPTTSRPIEESMTGRTSPGDTLELLQAAPTAPTLHEPMLPWKKHRPSLSELERLAQAPGIASGWRNKINQRLTCLKASS